MQISIGMSVLAQKKIEENEFKRIMEEHKLWLADRKQGKRADFSDVDLSDKDLSGMNFSYADMEGANLSNTILKGANLSHTYLRAAHMHNADLSGAKIEKTCFSSANLTMIKLNKCKGRGAFFDHACMWDGEYRNSELQEAFFWDAKVCACDFSGADLEGACFLYADLDDTVFVRTNLKNADFSFAKRTYWCDFAKSDMTGADMTDVDLDDNLLKGVKGLYTPIYCPEEGAFIAWKKCRDGRVVKLLIPEHAERKGSALHSCRASEAIVLEIFDKAGNPASEAVSILDEEFRYVKGETVFAKEVDKNCYGDVSGIYFVLSRAETEQFHEKGESEDKS